MEQIGMFGHVITLVHYVFQVEPERIACMPNMTEFGSTQYHPNVLRSNGTGAVTCPECKTTDAYKRGKERGG